RQVLLVDRDRLLVILPIVVDVAEAAERVDVLRLACEDVLEGGRGVRLVGGVELSGPRLDLGELHPRVDVLGTLLRLCGEVRDERLRRLRQLDTGGLPRRRRGPRPRAGTAG